MHTTDVYGSFIQPDRTLETAANLPDTLGMKIHSGYRARDHHRRTFLGKNYVFDRIVNETLKIDLDYEDQCSAKYYFDMFCTLRDYLGEYNKVVEVGVYMGGATSIIAGCMGDFHFDLDLVDIRSEHLRFAYERIRRTYGAKNIRLFWGDLPTYVKTVMLPETKARSLIHHDGAHDFNVVMRDLGALSFVRDRVHALIMQDTHLRGRIRYCNFVDVALYATFGEGMAYAPIGAVYREADTELVNPNPYQGNYFIPGAPEGMVIPLQHNTFRYPHPSMALDEFMLPPPA